MHLFYMYVSMRLYKGCSGVFSASDEPKDLQMRDMLQGGRGGVREEVGLRDSLHRRQRQRKE